MPLESFLKCEVCLSEAWELAYEGLVRDGPFGRYTGPTRVARCSVCGVERLDEITAPEEEIYTTADYRNLLAQRSDAVGYLDEHDAVQLDNLRQLWPNSLRGKVVADIGCAGGSFLDHVGGLAARTIAVEPCVEYHDSLKRNGHDVYPFTCDALASDVSVDWAFAFGVIEHVSNPREFLCEIGKILKPEGRIIVSTPNRRDVLMSLLPDDYPRFFYRSVHRWYFDRDSLTNCASMAGLSVVEVRCFHRYGISNAMTWLRDRRPSGRSNLPHVGTALFDDVWARGLEAQDAGDYLFAVLERDTLKNGL